VTDIPFVTCQQVMLAVADGRLSEGNMSSSMLDVTPTGYMTSRACSAWIWHHLIITGVMSFPSVHSRSPA